MRFGRDKEIENGVKATALVVDAQAPAETFIGGDRGTIRILVDTGSGPVAMAREFNINEHRWLVRGMEVPVTVDPAKTNRFDVDWDAIPSMEERAAANDPTLVDPLGAKRKVAEALVSGAPEAQAAGMPDHFKEAMEKAEQADAPAGKLRAVVLVATIRGKLTGDEHSTSHEIQGKSAAVLSVNIPGRSPYATYIEKFKVPRRGKWDISGAGLPALVSSSDPSDIEVLWKEVPSLKDQVGQRISDALQGASAGVQEQQMMDALRRAGATPGAASTPGATPTSGAAATPGLPAEMQAAAAKNAKQALKFIKDPAQRKLLIDQYRAAGIQVDEED